jgi:putative hydrolase of the HAD superfamily
MMRDSGLKDFPGSPSGAAARHDQDLTPMECYAEPLSLAAPPARVDTWVFDLDNTLYPATSDLWPKIDQRITLYLGAIFGLDGMSSRALQKYYYERYGTTLRGLMEEHDIRPEDFLDFTHDIDRSSLLPDPMLADAITALPGRKLILTNGSREHALLTAAALGLEAMFEDIFDIADAGFLPKPAAETYERFFDRHEIEPSRAVMFDDLGRNLIIPHQKGMTTVLVVPKPGQKVHREAFEITLGGAASYIDFVTSDLARFLHGLVLDPKVSEDHCCGALILRPCGGKSSV